MEHGVGECSEEQSDKEITIKMEVEDAAVYVNIVNNANFVKEEPGLVDPARREPGLPTRTEAVKDGGRDLDEQRCAQSAQAAASTPAIAGSMNAADGSLNLVNILNIKEELGDIDAGPTVLQRMDIAYRTNQPDMSVVKQENAHNKDENDSVPCSSALDKLLDDEWKASLHSNDEALPEQHVQSQCFRGDKNLRTYKAKKSTMKRNVQVHGTVSHKYDEGYKCKNYDCFVCKETCKSEQDLRDHYSKLHEPVSTECEFQPPPKLIPGNDEAATNATGNDEAGTNATGNDEAGTNATGNEEAATNATGNDEAGTNATGNDEAGTNATGNEEAATNATGNDEAGTNATGNDEAGTNATGNDEALPEQHAQSQCFRSDKNLRTYKAKKSTMKRNVQVHGTVSHKYDEGYKCKTYNCFLCKETCKSEQDLRDHFSKLHGPVSTDTQHHKEETRPEQRAQSRRYACDECAMTYKRRESLNAHFVREHVIRHKCTECNKSYKCWGSLAKHFLSVHRKQQQTCTVCKKVCSSKKAMRKHVAQCHAAGTEAQRSDNSTQSARRARTQLYSCDKCVKTYTSKKSLRQHSRNSHSTEYHKCTKCDKKFPSISKLHVHTSNVHYERYECAVCKKIYTSKVDLTEHLHKHHQPRPADLQQNRCDKCLKTYKTKITLRKHREQQHGTESHKCTECNKEYQCRAYLLIHMRLAHSKQQRGCAICKKIFKSKLALSNHVLRLRGHRPVGPQDYIYTCDYCQKAFWRKPALRQHIESVHGALIHRCEKCNRIYKSRNTLQQHNTSVHGKPPNECEVCRRQFTTKYHLRAHVKNAHRSEDVQFKSDLHATRPTVCDLSAVANTSTQQHDEVIVKGEPADGEMELSPVVFQHMDCNYRPYKAEHGMNEETRCSDRIENENES